MADMPKRTTSSLKSEWTVTPILVKATTTPAIVTVPARLALAVDGKGAPASDDFQKALQALYGVAYGLKFGRKRSGEGMPFKVAALEGRWSAEGWTDASQLPPPDRWTWRLRITVPPDVTLDEVAAIVREAAGKKSGKLEGNTAVARVFLESIPETRCGRILHVGPYADEPRSFAALAPVITATGARASHHHIEIYLGDPRRAEPDKLKTVLLKELT
jgi:hypothetical protein